MDRAGMIRALGEASRLIEYTRGRANWSKPLIGGVWGSGQYELHAQLSMRAGLHAMAFCVVHIETGSALSIGDTHAKAMSDARALLKEWPDAVAAIAAECATQNARIQARIDDDMERIRQVNARTESAEKKPIPRRRKQVFEKSQGKCHYCDTSLDIEGAWHIEHMMPRALMGTNEPSNLVASCIPCNMKKRDRTAEEFMAELAKEKA